MFCAYFDSLTCTRVFITSLSFGANRAVYRTIISSILRRWIITRAVSRVISPSASYRARIPCTPISPNTIYCFIYMLYQYLSSLLIYYNTRLLIKYGKLDQYLFCLLLGQGCSLQVWLSVLLEPSIVQSSPPNWGSGLSHVRFRDWYPTPQVTVQTFQSLHSPQTPSTVFIS